MDMVIHSIHSQYNISMIGSIVDIALNCAASLLRIELVHQCPGPGGGQLVHVVEGILMVSWTVALHLPPPPSSLPSTV